MEFKDLQNQVLRNAKGYSEKHEVAIDTDFAALKLAEEVGEFFQALLIHQQKCRKEKRVSPDISKAELAKELADVTGLAMILAETLGINLEQAVKEKWSRY